LPHRKSRRACSRPCGFIKAAGAAALFGAALAAGTTPRLGQRQIRRSAESYSVRNPQQPAHITTYNNFVEFGFGGRVSQRVLAP
jgi:hypothetical protein